jgi:hypothetical protein
LNLINMSKNMEHSHKSWSHAVGTQGAAVLLGFGFVFASAFAEASADRQSQALKGRLLRSASPKRQNPSLPHSHSIFSNAPDS